MNKDQQSAKQVHLDTVLSPARVVNVWVVNGEVEPLAGDHEPPIAQSNCCKTRYRAWQVQVHLNLPGG